MWHVVTELKRIQARLDAFLTGEDQMVEPLPTPDPTPAQAEEMRAAAEAARTERERKIAESRDLEAMVTPKN
jgi:DNA helicase IV